MRPLEKETLWRQFGAAIDMFGNAVRDCPNELWAESMWEEPELGPEFSTVWYVSFHTLFWLDLYLSGAVEGFTPPPPYTLDELDPAGRLPPRAYTQEELLGYLAYCRAKCRELILALTDESAYRVCHFRWGALPYTELLLYTLRHVQEHGAQMRMFLGQRAGKSARWVGRVEA